MKHDEDEMSAIGELETMTLLAILHLGDTAYGVSVRDEIGTRTGRRLTRGAIYTVLRRLEAKGFVDGTLGETTPSRGGRAKRFLVVTHVGMTALRSATGDLDRMRAGLDKLLADA
jgi:DNA-binding PadR family transcriptional regulator